MPDRRHEPTARKLVDGVERARDRYAELDWVRRRLDREIEAAERDRLGSEALLDELTAKLERIATARRAAEREQRRTERLKWEQHMQQLRVARNARRRRRYRERAELHESGNGRPVRIEVNPDAWLALRAEAARRRIWAKVLLGEIARGLAAGEPGAAPTSQGPRWQRTGEGRRVRHSTLVEIDDDGWGRVRARALAEGLTIARLLGRAVEEEARRHGWSTTWPDREATSMR